ncbi:uncharacterized protein OCT59_003413 [Rhizophagus irregularis]|uniref:Uncharacterized protein n=3 Tax=Rhizophagus irregularis TaxID=588596 RepID=A0A2I1FE96_9GLOM|nr:hypothetical protein RhiirB3_492775 [Rhizophagus irregularis]GBC37354.2 hypothetical protein GLOIN_2v1593210 [Rhizophagus irregularis DAOM 181602=DAOM 197198]UZO11859.1 hypothetical protein OCT59_003413 [Rhizophagus irregularis]CAB4383823.1 unnamed protein product [Rhizophagus irregularis]CAB4485810.1 unnamed protein product [Rhizophagus irregularis]
MISQMINELYITNIISSREFNNEEKIKSILQLFRVSFEDKQQMINDQANLISSQQKLIEIIVQKKNGNENNTTNNVVNGNDLIKSNDITNIMNENNNGIRPLYKVFIGQLPPNIPIVQIKNHLNEIFGHVDSVYQLIPNSNYAFALFSNYESCQKAISRGNIKIQDKSFYIHNAHDRE